MLAPMANNKFNFIVFAKGFYELLEYYAIFLDNKHVYTKLNKSYFLMMQ